MGLDAPMLFRYFINVTSYTYNIFKLDWLYSDHCMQYEYRGFVDRNDALVKRKNEKIFHERNELFIHTSIRKNSIEIYIIDALESWLGFTSIGINPIHFLFKFENDPSEGEPPSDETRIRSHEREMAGMKIQLLNLRREILVNRNQIQVISRRNQNLQFDSSI